ncbi:MAG: hypothetical protein GY953_49210, partial [bacterium]|nr:hypothetical protein [bacterium]
AQALMPPLLETADAAATLVKQITYPPRGTRGAAFGIAHDDFRARPVAEVLDLSNDKTGCVTLIESVDGIRNCDAIAVRRRRRLASVSRGPRLW